MRVLLSLVFGVWFGSVLQCVGFISRVCSSQWLVSQWLAYTTKHRSQKTGRASRGARRKLSSSPTTARVFLCDLCTPRLRRQIGICFLPIHPMEMICPQIVYIILVVGLPLWPAMSASEHALIWCLCIDLHTRRRASCGETELVRQPVRGNV